MKITMSPLISSPTERVCRCMNAEGRVMKDGHPEGTSNCKLEYLNRHSHFEKTI